MYKLLIDSMAIKEPWLVVDKEKRKQFLQKYPNGKEFTFDTMEEFRVFCEDFKRSIPEVLYYYYSAYKCNLWISEDGEFTLTVYLCEWG